MKFLKTLLAATLGTLIGVVILFVILTITISAAGDEPEPYVRDNSVLKIRISGGLPAKSIDNPFDELLNQSSGNSVSLQTLKQNLTKAASDDNIKGVLLEIGMMGEGWANLEDAYRTITQFRDSTDKFIYATTDDVGFNEKGYYLASAADSVFSPPESFFEFDGFYNQVTFYKGLFDKIGVEEEIIRSGKYKGAVEPYFREELSEENEYQLQQIMADVTDEFMRAVTAKTGKSRDELDAMLNRQPHLTTQFGFEQGFIDTLLYPNELDSLINRRAGLADDASYNSISFNRYNKVSNESAGVAAGDAEGSIGVIYASGVIMPQPSGGGISPLQNQTISVPWFKKQLENATDDDDVKALVVRINSPGGSGSTSDIIWKMIRETRKDIPVIVSMGPVAASGGYYIAMAADTIVAESTTITGSIGVFAGKINANDLYNEKLGITFDEVKSHEHADWLSPTHGLSASEEKAFQQYIDGFYDTFITKVADSRGLTKQQVDAVAQGRVWTGADAKEQQLVDVIGGMDEALRIAATKANLEGYDIHSFPESKSLFELMMGSAETKARAILGTTWLGNEHLRNLNSRLSMLKQHYPVALFPYEITIE